jgi:cell division septum initiation protein DivIVA
MPRAIGETVLLHRTLLPGKHKKTMKMQRQIESLPSSGDSIQKANQQARRRARPLALRAVEESWRFHKNERMLEQESISGAIAEASSWSICMSGDAGLS